MANTTDNAPAGQFLQLSFGPIDEILHASWDIQLSQGIEQLTADQKLFYRNYPDNFQLKKRDFQNHLTPLVLASEVCRPAHTGRHVVWLDILRGNCVSSA